jgi:hypothetical protein
MSSAVGHRVARNDVIVSANANTRILNLRYTARTTRDGDVGTNAAATAVLQRRAQVLRDRLASTSASLVQQSAALQTALSTLDRSTKVLEAARRDDAGPGADPRVFDEARAELLTRAGIVTSRLARAETTALDAGDLVRPVTTRVAGGRFRVSLVSGAMAGLVVGLFVARFRELIGRQLRRRGAVAAAGLPLLAKIDRREVNEIANRPTGTERSPDELRAGWRRAVSLAVAERPAACVAVRNSAGAGLVAGELERWVNRTELARATAEEGADDPGPAGVLLVASADQRVGELADARSELERVGQKVVGVVLV